MQHLTCIDNKYKDLKFDKGSVIDSIIKYIGI